MTLPDGDPDLEHLFELLRMLPGPGEDRPFWAAVQAHAQGQDPESATEVNYVFEKMAGIWLITQEPSPSSIAYLAKYLLFFFSSDDPEQWKTLNHVTVHDFSLNRDDTGRWWAKDLCETAWALYVRYSPMYQDEERFRLKWQFEKSWLEWLPPRD